MLKPVIKIGKKLFTGDNHGEAIINAKKAGEDTSKIDRERDGMFQTDDGRVLTRAETKKEFGISYSHEIPSLRKFILITNDWSGLGFAIQEIQRNKSEVIIGYKPKEEVPKDKQESYNIQGKGIVKTYPLEKLMAKRDKLKDCYWIFDGNHNTKEGELLKKEGFKTFNGTQFQYDLENDREFGLQFAEKAGLISPPFHEFKSPEEGISFLEQNEDTAYVVKPNGSEDSSLTEPFSLHLEPKNANLAARQYIKAFKFNDYILQERKKGVEINVEIMMSEGKPVLAQANLECKKRGNGDLGKATGCAMDVCWIVPLESRLVKETCGKLVDSFLKVDPKYTGFIDSNVIIGEDNIWFLEFCARTGYNAHVNFFSTISKKTYLQSLADLIDGITLKTKSGFGASVTMFSDKEKIGLPIYIPESMRDNFYLFDAYKDETNSDEEFCLGGYSQDIGVATAQNYTIPTAFQDAIANAWKVRFRDRTFRTDGDKTDFPTSPIRRYEALQAMGLV